jgi:aminoglycoside phosphotransferase (APT) family kinase protein
MSADLAAQLQKVVAEATGDAAVEVEGLRRLSGGASRETWSFDARMSDGSVRPLILRRDPPGARDTTTMGLEARILRAARAAGVPVPEVLGGTEDLAAMGVAFLIMERVEGETIPRKILRDEEFAAARPMLAAQCGRVLARIHRIPADGALSRDDPVARYREVMDTLGEPHPAFELGLRWLEQNRPAPGPDVVVHGDFRNGNLIVGADGVRAVLDWELVHIGDPMEDLGWLCVKAWRFGVTDKRVGGFGDVDDLIRAYEDESGQPIDRDALLWWEAMGTLKWGVMCIMQASAHTSGLLRSVELAAIGRRVCENEWDLLQVVPQPWGCASR